jgi:DNA-binding transcriptional MerR regulator
VSSVTFTAPQACRLADCTTAQLRRWAQLGLAVPAAPDAYCFRDLVALRLIAQLHRTGLSTARIRRALEFLAASGDDLASLRIVTDGTSVWVCRTDGEILDALRHGQLALFVALDRFVADVDAAVQAFDAERQAFVDQLRGTASGPT